MDSDTCRQAATPPPPLHRAFESVAATLTKDDVERFGRQMLVEEIGAVHMEQIRAGRVVCVGAGGLGSTILLYLAAAGVGHLTIVDFDDVEVSNLHRQVIHTSASVGRPKAESAKEACLRLFPAAQVTALNTALTPANAERLFAACDVVVDGTDNVAARYLVNDAAMRCRKPLVSGSAMGWDGQLSVYGYGDGPCYRCLFPVAPPPAAVGSCNDSGVVGPLPGMIGCLQALETLKVLTGVGEPLSGRLFVFNGLRFTSRVVKLRGKQPQCTACSAAAVADKTPLAALAGECRPEYVTAASCAVAPSPSMVPHSSCTVQEFARSVRKNWTASADDAALIPPAVTLDVRVRLQYDMAHLPGSICVPYQKLQQWERAETLVDQLSAFLQRAVTAAHTEFKLTDNAADEALTVYVVCRRGINSVKAIQLIQDVVHQADEPSERETVPPALAFLRRCRFINVEGGLNAYHRRVDTDFPFY